MTNQGTIPKKENELEGIDFEKLRIIIQKKMVWIILIFLSANTAAYLVIRWTKDLYESESELKLEFKSKVPELGFNNVIDDANVNFISGEIELIKSKLFFSKVIEKADIEVSYFSIGKVLNYEMHKSSPFFVKFKIKSNAAYDTPYYFNFTANNKFQIKVADEKTFHEGSFDVWMDLGDVEIKVKANSTYQPGDDNDYFFIINSQEKLLNYLADNISVEPLKLSANTIRIAFKDNNGHKAYELVSIIDSLYLEYSYQEKNLANIQQIEWLNNELSQIEHKLEQFEDYFEKFTLSNKTSDLGDDLKRTITAMASIDSQRFEINKRLTEINKLINQVTLENDVDFLPGQLVYFPPTVQKELDAYLLLNREYQRLSLTYNERTIAYRQKEAELDQIKTKLFNTLTDFRTRWTLRMAELNTQKQNLEKQFAGLPGKSTEFGKNQRFYKLYEELYLALMQSKAQFEIAQAGSTPDFKIFAPATFPRSPISPNKLIIVGIGFVGGISLAFFFIGFAYVLNNKITNQSELERLTNLPILGTIPELFDFNDDHLYVINHPKSMLSEAVRTLRSNLDFFSSGKGVKVITVTSTVSGEGKSFLSSSLASLLALSKKRVLLIDADMRKNKNIKPSEDNKKGLSTALINMFDWQECIKTTGVEDLDYLPSGPHPPNPSELLINDEFGKLMTILKEKYDFVIIDTPPVGLVTDAVMTMKYADLFIYMIRANYSHKSFINNLHRLKTINKFDNLCIVLNALPVSRKRYGAYYYEEKNKSGILRSLFRR